MKKLLPYYFGILVLAIVICFPLILPYFKTGFFPTHDGEWAVVRLSDMYREIKDFQFPARYSGYLNFQYGYPLFNFEYPLPYYLGLIFVALKFGFVNSIKILFSLSAILSFFSMFLLSASIWKNRWAGFISSVLYIYVPYRLVDLYVRGSIGESLSFVLFPLILLGIKRIYEKQSISNVLLVGFLYSLLITTHNIMTVLFGLVIMLILLVALIAKKINFIFKLFLSLVFSLILSAFFWIPAIFEKNLILLSKIPIANRNLYFVKPLELIIPKWGYQVPTDPNGLGYQIGIPQLAGFCVVLFLLAWTFLKKKKNNDSIIALFLAVSAFLISLLFFSQTSFIWSHVPLLSEINYPWTLLAIEMFLISLLVGFVTKFGKYSILLGLGIAAASILLFIPHAKPQSYVNRGDLFYLTNQGTTTSSNEIMPLWVKKQPDKSFSQKVEANGAVIEGLSYNSRKISFALDLPKKEIVRINTIYYPGWNFKSDSINVPLSYNNPGGLIDLNIDKGSHVIRGEFSETPLRLFSDIVSVCGYIFLVGFMFMSFKKKI